MKNGTRNEKVVFDIIFNLICMIYIIYSWMSITNVGVVTALTHNNLLLYTLICQKYGRQYILTHNLRIYADRIFYLPNYL